MPRTALTLTAVPAHAGTTVTTSAVDPTNGHEITLGSKLGTLVLDVNNTHATLAKTVTVKSGTHTELAPGSGQDLVVSVPALTRRLIPIRDFSRFMQPSGKVWVDLEAAITGTILAYRL
jgi:hypothetical protein